VKYILNGSELPTLCIPLHCLTLTLTSRLLFSVRSAEGVLLELADPEPFLNSVLFVALETTLGMVTIGYRIMSVYGFVCTI